MHRALFMAPILACALAAATPSGAFTGAWGTQNGRLQIQIAGSTVQGTYTHATSASNHFRFTCAAQTAESAQGTWQFLQPGSGSNSGPISLRLLSASELHIVMTYGNGKPMLDARLRKVVPASFEGTWNARNGAIRIARSASELKGTYRGRTSRSGDFDFTCSPAGGSQARGSWVFADGSASGPITLALEGGRMRIHMTYADGKPMLNTLVDKAP